ncbi:MAG: conjugal transfer protein TraF [Thermoanaerobaculia bacterium]
MLTSRALHAQLPFIPFGARSVALGGASVGLADAAGGVLDNPAAVEGAPVGVSATLGAEGNESGDFLAPLRLISGNDPVTLSTQAGAASAADVRAALLTLSQRGNGLLADGRAGAVVVYRRWGIGLAEYAWAGVSTRADLIHVQSGNDPATSFRNNRSVAAFRGLTIQDLSLSRGISFLGGRISVAGSAHLLRGITSSKEEAVFTTEVGDTVQLGRRSLSGTERTELAFSADAGVAVKVGIFRAGAVVKAINNPSFRFDETEGPIADRGASVTYGPQARVGASVHIPLIGIVVAADYDVTKSDTLIDGLQSREVGGGVEWTLGVIALRGGVSINLESPDQTKRISGGLGIGFGPVKADAAVIYRPDRSALGAVLSARLKL